MHRLKGGIVFKRKAVLVILIGLVHLIAASFVWVMIREPQIPQELPKQKMQMRTDIKVVLDPGHGGIDSGTHDGQGLLEKDITLNIGLRMRDFLHEKGVPVIMTRETDDDVSTSDGPGRHRRDLQERVKIINRGTVAISIHVNSCGNPKENGCVVFYAKGSQQGKELAEKILGALADVQNLNHDFAVPRKNLYLLNNSSIPVVLVEVGFLSNEEDKQKLQDPNYLQTLAETIGRAIIE